MVIEHEDENYVYLAHDSHLFYVDKKALYEAIVRTKNEEIGHYWALDNQYPIFLNSLYGDEILQALLFRHCKE